METIDEIALKIALGWSRNDEELEDMKADIVRALRNERERCAAICDREVAAMQRVADFHRPPRVFYDEDLATMHDQGAAVAFKLAAAIREPAASSLPAE